ncbi:mitochondrial DNA polymerase [Saccharomyces pastorianus]|uniref:Mitochondrial DNA polymerase n=1 Tax=Saccharomyces pastorianus TaxID=27292 RepID=A0A6C1EA00_SACPS|nr:POG1-like protein [Saccharomyces eubayanus]KOG98782.1 POG1-like protein [Saccharomyces eubayanus]QID85771.1 mitochondrial DNA polymerase [Saccharomyces pastorianus]
MEREPHNQSEEEKKPTGPMAAEGGHHSSSSSGTTMVAGVAEESVSRRTTGPSQTKRSLLLRIKLLKQLGINDIQEIDVCDANLVDRFLSIRLVNDTKELEKIRDSNLTKLNQIIDKCVESDNISDPTLNKILDMTISREINNDNSNHLTVPSPTMTKKRKAGASELASPRGHRRYRSDIPTVSEVDAGVGYPQMHQQPGAYTLPVPANQWMGNPYMQPPQQLQALPPQYLYPPGMGPQPPLPTMNSNPESQTPVMSSQYLSLNQHGLYQQNMRAHPLMNMGPQANIYGQQQPQQPQPAHERDPSRKSSTHRRSQSANISMANFRSPMRNSQHGSSQRPVNFLIHTPKHPPPT